MTSGSLVFSILIGVGGAKVHKLDGLVMSAILDAGRTPTATAIVWDRVGDLGHDAEADEQRYAEMSDVDPRAPEGSISPDLIAHLTRDTGPAQQALGGDWLLRMPVSRSLAW